MEAGEQTGLEASQANDRDFALPDEAGAEAARYRSTTDETSGADPDAETQRPEAQTARGISPEEDGIPDLHDDSPTMQRAEDPQFMPLPGETPTAVLDWGTTALEQSQGEPLAGRLERELPDVSPDDEQAGEALQEGLQLHQDLDSVTARSGEQVVEDDDSGTGRTGDDMLATGEEGLGGEGPEEAAVHVIED